MPNKAASIAPQRKAQPPMRPAPSNSPTAHMPNCRESINSSRQDIPVGCTPASAVEVVPLQPPAPSNPCRRFRRRSLGHSSDRLEPAALGSDFHVDKRLAPSARALAAPGSNIEYFQRLAPDWLAPDLHSYPAPLLDLELCCSLSPQGQAAAQEL